MSGWLGVCVCAAEGRTLRDQSRARGVQHLQEVQGEEESSHRSAGRGLHGAVRYLLHCFQGKKKVNQKYDRGQHMPRCQWPESAASSAHDGIMLHPLVQQRPVSLFTNPGGHTANLPLLLSWHLCSSMSC